MKSTQDKFRLVSDGKILKKDFLTEVKRTHSNVIHQTTTYKDAVQILKNKNIINEHFLGLVTQKPVNNINQDWFSVFRDNVLSEEENDVKAELKKPDKEVVELETKGYDYKDPKNVDNVFGQEFLSGYYTELKNPKNADKTEVELKEIVTKNLEKNKLYYTEEAQFGIEGIGYTADAPGLKASKSDQMVPVKEGKISYRDFLLKEYDELGERPNWFETQKQDYKTYEAVDSTYEEDDIDISSADPLGKEKMKQGGFDVTEEEEETQKPKAKGKRGYSKKETIETKIKEIEKAGNVANLNAKIEAIAEEVTMRQDKLNVAENMDEVAEFINPVRIKEMQKDIRLLEKQKGKYVKMFEKLTGGKYREPIMDEDLAPEV